MIQTTLHLRFTPKVLRPTAALLVPSADPWHWLEAACVAFPAGGKLRQADVRVLVVPRSAQDRTPVAALVVHTTESPAAIPPRCLAYGRLADRLLLPVEADLEPRVSVEELTRLLSANFTYLWHPAVGLIAYEADDFLPLAKLIQLPRREPRPWDRAQPAQRLPRRLLSLTPEEVPDLRRIMELGQDDIGTQGDEISQLPPDPGERKPGLGSHLTKAGLTMMAGGLAGLTAIGGLAGMLGGGGGGMGGGRSPGQMPSGANWMDRFDAWIRQRMAEVDKSFLSEREREINRLMNLLDSDPDQGLKFALPLGGDAARGVAPPGSRLMQRMLDYGAAGGGGGAADFWDLSWERRQALIARYRELAARELQLGRFRRAAYIYGELLADHASAASALAQGKHWREAATVYQKRLDRPLDAARCLEQGGLWTEALALYTELDHYENVGDIHAKLEQQEEAQAAYRQAVEKLRLQQNWLAAAELLEHKLDSVDEAIAELAGAWPRTFQAKQCLAQLLETYGRLGRHAEAAKRIRDLRQDSLAPSHRLALLEVFAQRATTYPDRSVKHLTSDSARMLAAELLTGNPGAGQTVVESKRVLAAVRQLAPQDRLHARDCSRFTRSLPVEQPLRMKPPTADHTARLIQTLHLGREGVQWKAAISAGDVFFAAGIAENRLLVTRRSWQFSAEGVEPPIEHQWDQIVSDVPILLAAKPHQPDWLRVHPMGGPALNNIKQFPVTDNCPFETHACGMEFFAIAAAQSSDGVSWQLEWEWEGNQSLTLRAITPDGKMLFSCAVDDDLSTAMYTPGEAYTIQTLPMHVSGHRVHLGIGPNLLIFDRAKHTETIPFESRVLSIAGSLPKTRPRVAFGLEQGGVILWDDFTGRQTARFAADLMAPRLTFNRGGLLIAADDHRCEVYATQSKEIHLKATFALPHPALAILAPIHPDEFAIFMNNGLTQVYRIEAS